MARCANRDVPICQYHGQKGIRVCKGWSESLEAFYADMGEPPPGMTIDRRENSGNYSCGKCEECVANDWPMNCRWATVKEQNRNRSITKFATHRGETRPIGEWAEIAGMSYNTLFSRLEDGWSIERALSVPAKKYKRKVARVRT
jgi:hypothetical protein